MQINDKDERDHDCSSKLPNSCTTIHVGLKGKMKTEIEPMTITLKHLLFLFN